MVGATGIIVPLCPRELVFLANIVARLLPAHLVFFRRYQITPVLPFSGLTAFA